MDIIIPWFEIIGLLLLVIYLLFFFIRDRRRSKRIKYYVDNIAKLNEEGRSLEAFNLLAQWGKEIERGM